MVLAGKEVLEKFVDFIESDERKIWLARVREAGFDQALSEFVARSITVIKHIESTTLS